MLAFVTVGSFEFDLLVQGVLSADVLAALQSRGYTQLVVQAGNSQFEFDADAHNANPAVELYKFKPSLAADYARADLVIGHAGAGTILDALRLGKALIVVPNPALLHNHQAELSSALAERGHLATSSVGALADTIRGFDAGGLVPFPAFDGSRFRALVDDEMGF
ncbi:glycosyltransferase family 1 protein [Mycena crocata]|nr:glycosyltransferase family 1 protein [Mycena crocata]